MESEATRPGQTSSSHPRHGWPPNPPIVTGARKRSTINGSSRRRLAQRLFGDHRGASNVEYIILLGVLAILSLGAWRIYGTHVKCAALAAGFVVRELELPQGTGVQSCLEAQRRLPTNPDGELARASTCSGDTKPSPRPTATASAMTTADRVRDEVLRALCPGEKALLQDLRSRNVKVIAFESIVYENQYYDGSNWVTKPFHAAGSYNRRQNLMKMISEGSDNATGAVFYHESIHAGQPASMSLADKEYEAYTKEDQWRIAHNMGPAQPGFRKPDPSDSEPDPKKKRQITDPDAIRKFVDEVYGWTNTTTPVGGGDPGQVIGKESNGDSIVRRADGSTYTRPPQKDDSFQVPPTLKPPNGEVIDIAQLQCP